MAEERKTDQVGAKHSQESAIMPIFGEKVAQGAEKLATVMEIHFQKRAIPAQAEEKLAQASSALDQAEEIDPQTREKLAQKAAKLAQARDAFPQKKDLYPNNRVTTNSNFGSFGRFDEKTIQGQHLKSAPHASQNRQYGIPSAPKSQILEAIEGSPAVPRHHQHLL